MAFTEKFEYVVGTCADFKSVTKATNCVGNQDSLDVAANFNVEMRMVTAFANPEFFHANDGQLQYESKISNLFLSNSVAQTKAHELVQL